MSARRLGRAHQGASGADEIVEDNADRICDITCKQIA
jgi:hypothetical protein